MIGHSNRWIESWKQSLAVLVVGGDGKAYPRGHSKVSSGLTSGRVIVEIKLPSTKTLAVPGSKVNSDAFFSFA